jgi:hypothetical protein
MLRRLLCEKLLLLNQLLLLKLQVVLLLLLMVEVAAGFEWEGVAPRRHGNPLRPWLRKI